MKEEMTKNSQDCYEKEQDGSVLFYLDAKMF